MDIEYLIRAQEPDTIIYHETLHKTWHKAITNAKSLIKNYWRDVSILKRENGKNIIEYDHNDILIHLKMIRSD